MKSDNLLDILPTRKIPWLSADQANGDVVFSTRVRLARNITGYPFPGRSSRDDRHRVCEVIKSVFPLSPQFDNAMVTDLHALGKVDRRFLFERHLIGSGQQNREHGDAVIASADERCSIIINEEDHLRLQVLQSGLRLHEVWPQIDRLDDSLSEELPYAFHKHYGYLTSCPSNVGTGLRASVMLHLPGLVFNGHIDSLIRAVNNLGFAVRGTFGEGSEVTGNLFQISNQSTLGEEEHQIICRLHRLVRHIITLEIDARQLLLERQAAELYDHVGRVYGQLRYCFKIGFRETMTWLSTIHLGIDLGMFPSLKKSELSELLVLLQSGHLQKGDNKRMTKEKQDMRRAEILKERLST